MKEPNTPSTPHTLAYRQSKHDSYAGWYESSLLSNLSPVTTGPPQALSVASRAPAPIEDFTQASPSSMLGPRERVRSLRQMKKALHSRETVYAKSEIQKKGAMTKAICEQASVAPTPNVQEAVKSHLSLTIPDDLNSSTITRPLRTPQQQRLSTPSAYVATETSPLTATSTKPRKSARFTRLIVEKLLLEPEELRSYTEPDLEASQFEVATKRPKREMGPVVRSIETCLLLLPMLGSLYMLGSSCMPYQWWRERLSIVRISLAVGKREGGPELLLSMWGWCVIQPGGGESTCSEPKLLYTMDSFFSTAGSRSTGGLTASSFNATTIKAFVALLPLTKTEDTVNTTKKVDSTLDDHEGKQKSDDEAKEATDQKAKNRLTSLGKRMTKLFGSSRPSDEEEACTRFEDQVDLKSLNRVGEVHSSMTPRDASLPQERQMEEENDGIRPKSVLKRLTLKTMSAIGKKESQ
ncbi:hypothetical protein QFC22_004174 [Naganishia vaughanmartiniae]|uniref:Uncharacterized protein n=1 Tax=Naganishia vaughanmartiniae TaxID=1424756 RepID=A0ACC2X3H5_9TREE|nr:hypothetical protein QFC22_004174 [Naganishia vaughanmartiniae]